MSWRTRWFPSAFTAAAVLIGFLTGSLLINTVQARGGHTETYQVPTRPQPGTELLAIFVGSSTCTASTDPDLKATLRRIHNGLRELAEREQKIFVSVGVALDQDPWRGIKFLERFGPFDEVLSGGNWLNTGSVAFILRDFPGRRAIPQLILIERDVSIESTGIASVEDRLVGRKVGSEAIAEFARVLQGETERLHALGGRTSRSQP